MVMSDCMEISGVVRHTYPRALAIADVRPSTAEMTDEVAWHRETSFLGGACPSLIIAKHYQSETK